MALAITCKDRAVRPCLPIILPRSAESTVMRRDAEPSGGTYEAHRTRNTHAADPGMIARARCLPLRQLCRVSGLSQHAVERVVAGGRVYPKTRERIIKAILQLELARAMDEY